MIITHIKTEVAKFLRVIIQQNGLKISVLIDNFDEITANRPTQNSQIIFVYVDSEWNNRETRSNIYSRSMRFNLILRLKNLRTESEAQNLNDFLIEKLRTFSPLQNKDRLRIINDSFDNFENGIWQYTQQWELMIPVIDDTNCLLEESRKWEGVQVKIIPNYGLPSLLRDLVQPDNILTFLSQFSFSSEEFGVFPLPYAGYLLFDSGHQLTGIIPIYNNLYFEAEFNIRSAETENIILFSELNAGFQSEFIGQLIRSNQLNLNLSNQFIGSINHQSNITFLANYFLINTNITLEHIFELRSSVQFTEEGLIPELIFESILAYINEHIFESNFNLTSEFEFNSEYTPNGIIEIINNLTIESFSQFLGEVFKEVDLLFAGGSEFTGNQSVNRSFGLDSEYKFTGSFSPESQFNNQVFFEFIGELKSQTDFNIESSLLFTGIITGSEYELIYESINEFTGESISESELEFINEYDLITTFTGIGTESGDYIGTEAKSILIVEDNHG